MPRAGWSWTKANEEKLRGLVAFGLSQRQIADALGFKSPSSIHRKMQEMGLTAASGSESAMSTLTPGERGQTPKTRPTRARGRPSTPGKQRRVALGPPVWWGVTTLSESASEGEGGGPPPGAALLTIPQAGCHWPEGDGPFTFCCAPRAPGARVPYCARHLRIAYMSTKTS